MGQPIGPAISNRSPRSLPSDEPLKGHHCTLLRLDPDRHAAGLFEAFAEDESGRNWTYLPYGPFDDLDAFSAWLHTLASKRDPLFYTISGEDAKPEGMASYLRIDPHQATIEVGHIHFSPSMQRTPMATEAMYLMMRNAFDVLGYRRYEWKCDALNAPSRAAAERLGFIFEGVFYKASHYKGRNRDTAWFSIVDDEWPARKDAFEGWLAPDNFDVDGKRIESLQAIASRLVSEAKAQGIERYSQTD
ncbi:GNAT family N-acetyltransferase [Thioalkalivibrio sp. HK1]|uniref:GNAT family N-acetyltransferase n=1 Tax=Thioalkalivibrio sp. HK1 TaxID=1469245 RepID=UPI0018CBF77D|nr:GNAT family protein [Thioalkalivibrio sp. HK1]